MKRFLLALALWCGLVTAASAQGPIKLCVDLPGNPGSCIVVNSDNPLPTVQTGTPPLPSGAATAANQVLEIADLNALVAGQIVAGTPITPGTATATQGVMLGCQYNSAGVTFTNGQQGAIPCGPNGGLYVGGTIPSGSADSGNPVKTGGVYNSTLPTFTNGQRGDIQLGVRGAQGVQIYSVDSATGMAGGTTNSDAVATSSSANSLRATPFNYQFNGSTWDRSFTCPSTASVSVTAGSTTELVALTSSQVIRVCSFVITASATGTAKFVYGTGSNCGSGTTDITAAMAILINGNITLSSGAGSVFRTIASNALCLVAATGNITGFITYAKY